MEMNNYLSEFIMFYCKDSKETASNYRRVSKEFCEYTMGQRGWNMDELVANTNKRDILMYIQELERRGLSPHSINFYISAVSTFFKYLTEFDYRDKTNPCDTVQRVSTQGVEQKQEYLTEDEYTNLLQAIKVRTAKARKFEFTSARDTLLVTLNLTVGLRCSEALNLTVEQFDKDIISIIGKGGKLRKFKVTDEIRTRFNEYMEVRDQAFNDSEDNDLLFVSVTGKELHVKDINKNLKKYCERCGIDKDITSHCLRRSCATHYLQEGIPVAQVSRLLGHSNPQTTMRYYKADGADFDFLGL